MKPYYQEQGVTLWQGDVRERLRQLPADTFNTCVTSPPYWGLRDYGHEGQLGNEETPEEYVANMVDVFREVRRCLQPDGTLWLNVGDTYNAYNGGRGPAAGANKNHHEIMPGLPTGYGLTCKTLKPKDLVGIPWRLAFALQADGWYLRSDIIWAKAVSFCPTYNGTTMPESVRDRPTKAHEYIFLLSKSDRYHYDSDAVREAAQDWGTRDRSEGKYSAPDADFGLPPHKGLSDINFAEKGRNLRSVWTVMPKPYAGAHFATFPEDLVRPCILAGAPAGGHVLEPFAGSGTTLKAAREEGRQATGIELNPEYCGLIVQRLAQGVLFHAGGAA